jgi:hypothetical protein
MQEIGGGESAKVENVIDKIAEHENATPLNLISLRHEQV